MDLVWEKREWREKSTYEIPAQGLELCSESGLTIMLAISQLAKALWNSDSSGLWGFGNVHFPMCFTWHSRLKQHKEWLERALHYVKGVMACVTKLHLVERDVGGKREQLTMSSSCPSLREDPPWALSVITVNCTPRSSSYTPHRISM